MTVFLTMENTQHDALAALATGLLSQLGVGQSYVAMGQALVYLRCFSFLRMLQGRGGSGLNINTYRTNLLLVGVVFKLPEGSVTR